MMKSTIFTVWFVIGALSLSASEWPHWRGPSYNGSSEETNLPSQWDPRGNENIRWVADLPGPSAATPIICRDSVFLSSTDAESNRLLAMCLRRDSGQLVWRHEVADETRQDTRSTYSSPSPVTDGKVVVFFYGNGLMVAYDFDGQQLWKRDIQKDYGEFAFQWTFSSTPLLWNHLLYLQVLQRDEPARGRGTSEGEIESYILALEPRTGNELWRVIRPSKAYAESREAFTSPVPWTYNGRTEILVAGGDCLTGHDPATGKELWRWGTWNPERIGHWRLVPSPVAGGDVILACAPKSDPIYAIRAGGEGTLDDSAIVWVSREVRAVTSDVPTPAFYDGDFFVLSDLRRCVSRVEPTTGKVKWTTTLQSRDKFEASPLVADGKIYLINFSGLVVILDAASGDVLQEISMSERSESPIRSSIVAAGGNLFVRTNDKLYCIGP